MKSIRISGFVLIELLVNLAIIALLMALLLPVLAEARKTVQRTICSTNLHGLSLALMMYAEDFDGAIYNGGVAQRPSPPVTDRYEYAAALASYQKNLRSLFCPARAKTGCYTDAEPAGLCLGYAPNFGIPSGDDGNGLFYPSERDPGYRNLPGVLCRGRRLSEFAQPGETILFGDTNDSPTYSLDFSFQIYDGDTSAAIRHSGWYQFVFVDGHARGIKMAPYRMLQRAFTLMPLSVRDIAYYCRDASGPSPNRFSFGYPLTCGEVAKLIARTRVPLPTQ